MSKFPDYKTISVDKLIPYARNSRTHSDEQVSKIAASIKEFGFLNPVIIDGENGIIAGHGRVMAAQKLGMEIVPVIEASHLTDAQRRAYVIADNKLAENAGWDETLLKIEFEGLQELDFDLDLLGFESWEIENLLEGNDWESDLKDIEAAGSNLDGIRSKITIEVDADDYDEMLEYLTRKLQEISIDSTIK